MIRTLFRLVAFVSLLLFVAVVALWVRGQWTMDHFWLIHGDEGSELIRSAEGRLALRHTRPNGRRNMTLPRRVSHWSCRVGSQLPPKPSMSHWQWQFVTYEGVPEATAAEVRGARDAIRAAETLRRDLRVTPPEWEGAEYYQLRMQVAGRALPPEQVQRLTTIQQARAAEARARDVLTGSSYWEWSVPAWLVAAVLAAPPAGWALGRYRRRRMRRKGRCPNCGYDLRASADRCPECGLAVGAGAVPTAPA